MEENEYRRFTGGYFTIRRSDKFWSGTWPDMVIEQTLNRSMKAIGGLIHGRSTRDSVKNHWIASAASNTKVCEQLESLVDVHSSSTEQHVDWRESRILRDTSDVAKLVEWLKSHSPFIDFDGIMSVRSGFVGDKQVNCHRAYSIGEAGRREIENRCFQM